MPLNPSTLANQLKNMTPTKSEIEAIGKFTDAYIAFMSESSVGGLVPIVPSALQGTPKTACMAAMTGLSTTGAVAIQTGLLAFWGAMVPLAATLYPTATLIVPPIPLSTLAPLLITVFAANTLAKLSLNDSCVAVASVIYTASLGGLATIPTPTPTPLPIL